MGTFLDSSDFRTDPKAGQHVSKGYAFQVKALDEVARTVSFVASTEAVDRVGDSIKTDGWRLDNYKNNPVVLFAHDSDDLPVGKAVSIKVVGKELLVTVLFASKEANPLAENVFQLIKEGCLNAVSVGFIPIRWEWVDDTEAGRFGMDIMEAELLEVSIVPVPAHPDALVQASMKGLDASMMPDWRKKCGGSEPVKEQGKPPIINPEEDANEAPSKDMGDDGDPCDPEDPMYDPEDPECEKAKAAAEKAAAEAACAGSEEKKFSKKRAAMVVTLLQLKSGHRP